MDSTENSDLPEPPSNIDDCYNGRRLWIGNVDTKITEFALLKLLQKYGELEKFDFLYHTGGPDKGKPRGYCFATYTLRESAGKAQRCLNGKLALSKRLVVKPAETEKELGVRPGTSHSTPENSSQQSNRNKQSQIFAIEAQLRKLERKEDMAAFLPANKQPSATNPLSHCLASFNPESQQASQSNTKSRRIKIGVTRNHRHHNKPYQKHTR